MRVLLERVLVFSESGSSAAGKIGIGFLGGMAMFWHFGLNLLLGKRIQGWRLTCKKRGGKEISTG